ncbi:MAG: hypothetical protein ABT20_09910 [Rubrivivax sp. SCN 70-15]|nr:MAG: hypothetical protein ABT20_09910 [Rubrivivax sp. SCN 70-15]
MTTERVMLLIDADNVSVDVMEQAVKLLLNQHGALHVRRAYCTAESAVKHQAIFKRLSIKPMVNLAAGKNSTDIALAVDAIDLVLAERPDVVVIASSDSDFAPLVARLREKGCVVRGIGQRGKTGDETQDAYDDFTVLEHHPASTGTVRAPAKRAAAKAPAAKKAAAKKVPAKKTAATKAAAKKSPARKTAGRKTAAPAVDIKPPAVVEDAPPAAALRNPTTRPEPLETDPGPSGRRGSASVTAVLACLPELAAGQALALNVAVQRLREAQLLGKNSSSLKLFSQLEDRFELLPPDKPSQVRLRR